MKTLNMEKTKTAVDWLVEQLQKNWQLTGSDIRKSKEMEKEQLQHFYDKGRYDRDHEDFEAHYNKTYENT